MGIWSWFMNSRARHGETSEDARLKAARNALAGALDDESVRLNDGAAVGYGAAKAIVSQVAREAQDLGSYVRGLDPQDSRIEEALRFHEKGLLTPFGDRAREVLATPWVDGFDANAKLDAVVKALHESL